MRAPTGIWPRAHPDTVRAHLERARGKLGAETIEEAVATAAADDLLR
jgi:hypothetical protein